MIAFRIYDGVKYFEIQFPEDGYPVIECGDTGDPQVGIVVTASDDEIAQLRKYLNDNAPKLEGQ